MPGGFGSRGISGNDKRDRVRKDKQEAYLGICLGMQLMAIEFARNVANLKDADSTEFNGDTTNKLIHIMEDQKAVTEKGGTMRLGAWPAKVQRGTRAFEAYGSERRRRHRQRYEFNNDYREMLEKLGLTISATTPDGRLVEIIEWKDAPGIATQAHPELKSRPKGQLRYSLNS